MLYLIELSVYTVAMQVHQAWSFAIFQPSGDASQPLFHLVSSLYLLILGVGTSATSVMELLTILNRSITFLTPMPVSPFSPSLPSTPERQTGLEYAVSSTKVL